MTALAKACANVREATDADAVAGVLPSWVAAPSSVREASALMAAAAERGLAVVPRGAGTKLEWGLPPRRVDVVIDTRGLNAVVEHTAGDLVARVQAGVAMEQLSEVLAASNQQLVADVPVPGSTVGGTLAAGVSGPRRLRYGAPRDLLIGSAVVRADGAVVRSGGKVVKNVAGYDLGKLFTGSYGTLGVIVEATFRLHPLPAARTWVTTRLSDAQTVPDLARALLRSQLVPSAIEIDRPRPSSATTVGVLFEGTGEGIAARVARTRDLIASPAEVTATPPDWWGCYPAGGVLINAVAPPAELAQVLTAVDASSDGFGLAAGVRGSAGSGVLHVGLPGDAEPAAIAGFVAALRTTARAVVVVAPDGVRKHVDMWGSVPALTLMRRVKDQFDPDHRLSPGRFVGGL